MRTQKYLLVFSLMVLGVLSCKKDQTVPKGKDCYDFKLKETGLFYDFVEHGANRAPCFNPNNPNEFVYYHNSGIQGIVELKRYNILSKQSTLIATFNQKVAGQPKWGRNGWIAFTSLHGGYVEHIYIVKDNGDSLRRFTIDLSNMFPFWDNDTGYLYWWHSPDLGSQHYLLRQKLNQIKPDSVGTPFGISDVLNQKWLHASNPYFGYHELNGEKPYTKDNFIHLANYEIPFGLTGLCWSNENSVFYYTSIKDGLYKVIPQSGQKIKLIQFCDSKRYETISCSSDGRYLVAERVDSTPDHDNILIHEQYKIYLIDLQTLTQTELVLD